MSEFEKELLALLDLIEVSEDSTLASQRFDLAGKYGYEVVFGEKISSEFKYQ